MLNRKQLILGFILVTICALALYIPFRSIQWDLNGIIEARAVEAGGPGLFSPNRLAYRPLGLIIYQIAMSLGYIGNSAVILQHETAILAAIGIGCAFFLLYCLTNNKVIALFATALLAVSWAYWTFSTDVYYITPAAMLTAGALGLIIRPNLSIRSSLAAGSLCALSILFWQANFFLVPSLAIGIWLLQRSADRTARYKMIGAMIATTIVIVGLSYIAVGIFVFKFQSVTAWVNWILSHGGQAADSVPLWGKLDFARIQPAVTSALASFIPVFDGLGLRDLLSGKFRIDKLFGQLSLFAMFGLLIWAAVKLSSQIRQKDRSTVGVLGWLLLGYILYLPFIIWWEPSAPKWFVIPNIFFIAFLAKLWSISPSRRQHVFVFVTVALIAVANWSIAIWPHHSTPNPTIALNECVLQHVTAADLLISPGWDVFGYMDYFYGFHGKTLSLIGGEPDENQKILQIQTEVATTHQLGGKVYLVDVSDYSEKDMAWITNQTGLTQTDFELLPQQPAFLCNDTQLVELL